DEQWIVGTGADGAGVCVWEVEALIPACTGDDLRPDVSSMVWAPDSSGVAFTDGSFTELEPNALWLYSIDDAVLTELSGSKIDGTEPVIHRAPRWTPDSQAVVFMSVENDLGIASIWVVDRTASQPKQVPVPAVYFQGPLVPTDDGRLMFTIGGSGFVGIWQVGLDGSGFEQVVSGSDLVPVPIQIGEFSADGQHLTVWSIGRFVEDQTVDWYVLDLQTGRYVPVSAGDRSLEIYGPILSTDGPEAVALAYHEDGTTVSLHDVSLQTGEATPIAGGEFEAPGSYWFLSRGAGSQLLVATDEGAVLVTMAPAG
ncbi:MAG TPA: hypothetical protein VD789_02390, partial [Thermomicrobiales bacterium]|nr:hypothetical protein [Thermomicrobiales bacterium]